MADLEQCCASCTVLFFKCRNKWLLGLTTRFTAKLIAAVLTSKLVFVHVYQKALVIQLLCFSSSHKDALRVTELHFWHADIPRHVFSPGGAAGCLCCFLWQQTYLKKAICVCSMSCFFFFFLWTKVPLHQRHWLFNFLHVLLHFCTQTICTLYLHLHRSIYTLPGMDASYDLSVFCQSHD